MRFIKYGLTEVDMFGKPISLFFYGKTKYNSSIGGCLTLSMITLILILSNSLLTSIIYRKEVYLTTSDKIDMIPTKISFKNDEHRAMLNWRNRNGHFPGTKSIIQVSLTIRRHYVPGKLRLENTKTGILSFNL